MFKTIYFMTGCANCVALEQQLKMKSEEIRRLKEGMATFFLILKKAAMLFV